MSYPKYIKYQDRTGEWKIGEVTSYQEGSVYSIKTVEKTYVKWPHPLVEEISKEEYVSELVINS